MTKMLMAVVMLLAMATVAFASVEGTWNVLLDEVVTVDFIGCAFSPCFPGSGTDIVIDGRSQNVWWRVRDGIIEILTNRGVVVAEGITDGSIIELMLDGQRYLLMRQPAE